MVPPHRWWPKPWFRNSPKRSIRRLNLLHVRELEDRLAPATFTVANTADSGTGSLRAALTSANGTAGTDDIAFDATIFASPQQIKLLTVLPDITGDLNFNGTNAANVSVTRATGRSVPAVQLQHLRRRQRLVLEHDHHWRRRHDQRGGDLRRKRQSERDQLCRFQQSQHRPGRRYRRSGRRGHHLPHQHHDFGQQRRTQGGGIYFGGLATLTMTGCTVSGNTASGVGGGGGLYVRSSTTISNCTFSGNHATAGPGGGILATDFAVDWTIKNSTVAFNDAKTTGGGIDQTGNTFSIESTIVAKTTAVTTGDDVKGAASFAKFNIIGETDGIKRHRR